MNEPPPCETRATGDHCPERAWDQDRQCDVYDDKAAYNTHAGEVLDPDGLETAEHPDKRLELDPLSQA
jgi:hypothetical protein